MLITITLLAAGLLGLLGLAATIVFGVKHAKIAVTFSTIWTAFAGIYVYVLTQSDFGVMNLVTLAVLGGTLVYLAFDNESALLN